MFSTVPCRKHEQLEQPKNVALGDLTDPGRTRSNPAAVGYGPWLAKILTPVRDGGCRDSLRAAGFARAAAPMDCPSCRGRKSWRGRPDRSAAPPIPSSVAEWPAIAG